MPEIIEQLKAIDEKLTDPELDPDLALQLFENCPDGIVIINSIGLIKFANRQTELMFGYRRRDLFDRPVEMLLPAEVQQRHVEHRKAFADDPRIRPMGLGININGMTKEGKEFEADINLCPLVTMHGTFYAAYIRKKRK